mmetsp:Transcript_126843/g.370861  ORF Transcript_126843/g.370861 Transcript_126843/m.370861 type:complete len:382 (-) Transcript_126843:325-1470(-)
MSEEDAKEVVGRTATLHCGQVDCHVIGVCHLSETSVNEVQKAIEELKPALVCLELCYQRESMLVPDPAWPSVLAPLSWATFKQQWQTLVDPLFWLLHLQVLALEALLGLPMGAEQAAAAASAKAVGASLLLIDRPQSITLSRTLAALASLRAFRDLIHGLRQSSSAAPTLAREVAELELILACAGSEVSSADFARAASLARHVVDALLNTPCSGVFGRAGEPIQEERDFLLSHEIHHACSILPPGSCAVAVLGAAHVGGVTRHFGSFGQRGCAVARCGVGDEVQALHTVPRAPLYGIAGGLLLMCGASLTGRWACMRYLRRTRGAAFARRVNCASLLASCGLGTFGMYRARRQYEAVRSLQLHRCGGHATSPSLATAREDV